MKKKKVSLKKLKLTKSSIANFNSNVIQGGGTIIFTHLCNASEDCPPLTKNCPTINCLTLDCVTFDCDSLFCNPQTLFYC